MQPLIFRAFFNMPTLSGLLHAARLSSLFSHSIDRALLNHRDLKAFSVKSYVTQLKEPMLAARLDERWRALLFFSSATHACTHARAPVWRGTKKDFFRAQTMIIVTEHRKCVSVQWISMTLSGPTSYWRQGRRAQNYR